MEMMELSSLLESAVIEVLEAMCFISAESVIADETQQYHPDWICGELDFLGGTSGTFGVAAPLATAATIAANFLGEEESDLTAKETGEVMCELTNMVCGTLLAQLDSRSMFALSPPRPGGYIKDSNNQSERIYRAYAMDEGCIHAWIEMKATA